VTGNLDVVVRYSVDPTAVLEIYREFQTQEAFVDRVILQGVREEARNAPATRGTLEVYNSRAQVAFEISESLRERWAEEGVIVEEVTLQEIRYSSEVTARFDDAQAARIAVDRAEAEQEAASVVADTLVIEAQGVADAAVVEAQGRSEANEILSSSLTEEILLQRYIDALNDGTIYVVPEGSTPFIGTR